MEQLIASIEPEAAQQAFSTLKDRLDELDGYRRANTDIDRAAILAAAVGRMVRASELRARFASLPGAYFDVDLVDILEPAALATWYASLRLRDATVLSSAATVPAALVGEATTVKQRMMRVLAYNLDDDVDVASKLDDIRQGTGHVDLASDLMRLARLYDEHASALAQDNRLYRAGDADEARRLALAIHQILGDGLEGDREYWADYRLRAWSFLVNTYEEVSAAGRWLFRNDEPERHFPSLYTVGRQRRRPAGNDDTGDGRDAEAGDPAAVEDQAALAAN